MATTTIAEALSSLLSTNWNLGAPLNAANIHFDVGWVDREWIGSSLANNASPQVIVSGPMMSPLRYFGKSATADAGRRLLSYSRYVVNIWLRVAAGSDGDIEEDYAFQMRDEVVRILNENGCSIATPTYVTLVVPLDRGRVLHELDKTPRLYRIEITAQVNYQT